MSSSNSNSNAATVRFDVGGTIYKVSRSLLKQHSNTMLTRMVSETWLGEEENNEGKDEPLFIDRDGERFRYVLDFMRDGPKVSLPVTVSKEGFLRDLDYFCFDNVNADDVSICSSHSVYMDTAKKIVYELEIKGEVENNRVKLAHYCFSRFELSYNLLVNMNHHNGYKFKCSGIKNSGDKKYQDDIEFSKLRNYTHEQVVNSKQIQDCLNKHLNEYNLKLLEVEHIGYGVFYLQSK